MQEKIKFDPLKIFQLKIRIEKLRPEIEKQKSSNNNIAISFDSVGAPCLLMECPGVATFGVRSDSVKYPERAGEAYFLGSCFSDSIFSFGGALDSRAPEIEIEIDPEISSKRASIFLGEKKFTFWKNDFKISQYMQAGAPEASFIFPGKPFKNSHYFYCNGLFARSKKGRGGTLDNSDVEKIPLLTPGGRENISFAIDGSALYKIPGINGARFDIFRSNSGGRFINSVIGDVIFIIQIWSGIETEKRAPEIFPDEAPEYIPGLMPGDISRWREKHPEELPKQGKKEEEPKQDGETPKISELELEKRSQDNLTNAGALFNTNMKYGFNDKPEGFYIQGKFVGLILEDAKIYLDKDLTGGAGFVVAGDDGKNYILEFRDYFWEDQESGAWDDEPEKQVRKRSGAKFDLFDYYGGDLREALSMDIADIYPYREFSGGLKIPLEWKYNDRYSDFQIYGLKADFTTARVVPCPYTETGRAIQLESENQKATFILEVGADLRGARLYEFYNIGACVGQPLEFLELQEWEDAIEKLNIIRIVSACPINRNETDLNRPFETEMKQEATAAGGALESDTDTNKEEKKMQDEKQATQETTQEPTNEPETVQPTTELATEPTTATGWTGRADFHERRDARRERREERIDALKKIAEAPVKPVTNDIAYWTQPAQNNAAGRAFNKQREKEQARIFNAIQTRAEASEKAARLEWVKESTAISADDPEALDKLEAKIAELTNKQERMKEANKKARAEGREAPYTYQLQNNNQNINRLKKRVDVLKRRQGTAWKNYVFDGGTIEADVAENRYKIFYDEKPEQKIIDALKASGWLWSRWGQCWQRMLNEATVRAIKNHNAWAHLADYLPGLTEDTDEPDEPESVGAELTEQPEPMKIKPEPKTREPEPEPIQDNEPEGAEPLDEPEPKEEAEMQTEKKPTRAELLEMAIEAFKNGYTDKQYLETLIEEMQAEKGYLTFNELYKVCETVNKSAWNVTFIFRPYFYGKESARKIAPFEKVVVDCRFYAYSGDHWYDVERRQGIYSSIGNARAQFVITVTCEIMEDLKPTESVEKWGDNVCEEIRGKWILNNIGDWLNQDVKDSFKTVNDIKRRFYTYCGRPHWGNRCIDLEYYKDGKKLEKEPGGASLVADYTIERVPTESRVIFKIYLGKNGAAVVKPEPVKKPEKVKPDPAAIPEEKQAEAAVEPVAIPEPAEPQPETVETQPEQVEAVKPTEREIRYAMSLLAMNFSRSDLVEKWLKRTKKPVRHDIVEKLIWTLDRGSVPKPGESKREYIKAYYQTH